VGDRHDIPLDFRLISATNVELAERVQKGKFREDLYYRLNVFPLHLPPLRERVEDIPLLAAYFRDTFAAENGLEPLLIPDCCMEWLLSYAWPGNVRELKHAVERALLLSQGEPQLTCESLAHVWGQAPAMSWSRPLAEEWSLERLERAYMAKVLEKTEGHKSEAARILGIDRRTLYRKLRRAPPERPSHPRPARRTRRDRVAPSDLLEE
jgi:DNA-binding NtrC family response regulator